MDAIVTVKFKLSNMCNEEDLIETGMTFEEMVKNLISEEGIMGLVDADEMDGEIISVEEYNKKVVLWQYSPLTVGIYCARMNV